MTKRRSASHLVGLLALSCALAATAQQSPAPVPGSVSIPLDATLAALKKALQQDPQLWDNYFNLGNYLLRSGGAPEEAAQVLLRFPPFHQQHPLDPVAVASWANDAGSLFYALGLPAQTRPFYRVAADLDTGSDASLCDAQRGKLLDGDFPGAAEIALERGNRFGNANAYRDYLSLLHVMGRSDEAWRTFAQVSDSFDSPQLWISALIAQRLTGKSEAEIRSWLLRPDIRAARSRTHHFATHEALWAFSTDRIPPADLGALVEQLDGPPVARADTHSGMTEIPHPTTADATTLIPSSPFRDDSRAQMPRGTLIKSEQAYFADAYAALRHSDFDTALHRFDNMADHYPIEHYPLAYFAFAAAKSGDPEKLEAYVITLSNPPNGELPTFDQLLAKAFFAGQRKDADTALKSLREAVRLRPYTDDRPVMTEYQYAEACEWLYQDTGDPRFVTELLDWSRKQQAVQPTFAWTYSMQYEYERPGAARTRALAMTQYLDPASPRITKATPSERAAAKAWLDEHPPFRPEKKTAPDSLPQ
jgi:tetratricopeptide (TPR) repeat protein